MTAIDYYNQYTRDLGDGIFNDINDWYGWLYIIIGFAMIAVCLYLIWLYFDLKNSGELLRVESQQYKAGSFKGFWGRYRGAIIAFSAAVFLIVGFTMLLVGFFGYEYVGMGDIFGV